MADIVTFENAPVFDTTRPFAEAIFSGGAWRVSYGDEIPEGDPETKAPIEQFKWAIEKFRREGGESRLLMSAPSGTPFREIGEVLHHALMVGYSGVDCLVRVPQSDTFVHAIHIDLPAAISCGTRPDIEPLFIMIRADGAIFEGVGMSRVSLDSSRSGAALPMLDHKLTGYIAAADSADSPPVVEIYPDGAAEYQRWIEVMVRCHAHGITRVTLMERSSEMNATRTGMRGESPGPGTVVPTVPPKR